MENEKLSLIFRARKTILQMLRDRNYHVPEDTSENFESFKSKFSNVLMQEDCMSQIVQNISKIYKTIPKDKNSVQQGIFVLFQDKPQFSVSDISATTGYLGGEKMEDNQHSSETNRAIIVSTGKITSLAEKEIAKLRPSKIFIEFFNVKDLQVNITEHELVPKHIIISQEEKEALLIK